MLENLLSSMLIGFLLRDSLSRLVENLVLCLVTNVQPAIAPHPAIRGTAPEAPTWGEWLVSLLSMPVSGSPTASHPNRAQMKTTTRAPPRATGHDCVICQDPIVEAEVRAPCGHFYDIDCITSLFQSATHDESLYPPRCCRQVIPLPQIRPHLTQALLAEFELKAREFGTLKRVYCATPACSSFLGPLYEGYFRKVFTCPSPTCITETCGKCRGRYEGYYTHKCTPDAETERVLTLSRDSGWSRCPGCSQMIELNMGCFHMTCRCKTEFCYVCSARWKSCRCPQWDENRLLAAAELRVDAQLQRANPFQQAPPVRQPMPAARAARNQHQPDYPPRQALEAAPRQPVVTIRPVDPPRQVAATLATLAALRPTPLVNTRPRIRQQEVPAAQDPPPPAPPSSIITHGAGVYAPPPPPPPPPPPSRPAIHHTEAPTLAPPTVPRPSRLTTRRAEAPGQGSSCAVPSQPTICRSETNTRISAVLARVIEQCPTSTANTTTAGEDRERMIRETMERLRMDHDCQHTTWKYQRGSGRCESCSVDLPNYIYRCGGCEILSCNRCRRNRL
ncbi:hypothetical protein K503DRAFT_566733 [Rhizopogon vinicolor AM-OR11-026]|uniref:RBR-type E3 ubiquitin transferase n=1 Tax=Rhizopogon vinicolor AM-OR11-026 TaxID=1314800 RepID=A0A1B7MK27_9AGAM|nr:hypothetical protein K503DRAFT_566733 [Rhizopogon vinicolor AM-OR11-026]